MLSKRGHPSLSLLLLSAAQYPSTLIAATVSAASAAGNCSPGISSCPPIGDGRREMDKELGWFHACSSYPLSDLKIKIPIM